MSDYGCCRLSLCVYTDLDELGNFTCAECPYYDKYFFKEIVYQEEEKDEHM